MTRDRLIKLIFERPVIREAIEEYLIKHSPVVRNYIKSMAKLLNLPEDVVARSEPVKTYISKLLGLDEVNHRSTSTSQESS